MADTTEIAQQLIELLKRGRSVADAKDTLQITTEMWFNVSSKAYALYLAEEKQQRNEDLKKPHVLATSNQQINELLELDATLANYALLLPSFCTEPEFEYVKKLAIDLPASENQILDFVGKITMEPRIRALQKKGRFEAIDVFKEFTKFIDAATICFYRENYISAYLTLAPLVEGMLLRWSGYTGVGAKPDFESLRKFINKACMRQPCPANILFHNNYKKACDKIVNDHLFKPSQNGAAYSNFNRHLAAHLLSDSEFANKENCIRLFLLIDTMTEIYVYESKQPDPRFTLTNESIEEEIILYTKLILDTASILSPERQIFNM